MPYPTKDEWIAQALTGDDGVWQIGQIDDVTARALNKLVRQGRLCKARGRFMGISNPKTIWHRPGLGFNIIECVQLIEAHGEAAEIQQAAYDAFAAQFSEAA